MSENENKFDISKHPLVVIVLAVAGTFGFSYQFVLPIMTAKLQNDVDKIPSYVKQIEEDQVKIDALNKKLEQLESQLAIVQNANLFRQGDPYPIGLGKVRIGDSVEKLLSIYGENNIEKIEDGVWKVKNAHSIFNNINYYFDYKSSKKVITHISFGNSDLANQEKAKFLKGTFEDIFGEPRAYKKKEFYTWEVAGERIYLQKLFNYVLMEKKYVPAYWPDE